MIISLFDIFLALTLIFLSWQILRTENVYLSIILFIVFGLLMALAWVQLRALDIALVEAAIGSGITGALFLGVLGRLESLHVKKKTLRKGQWLSPILPIVIAGLGGILCLAVLTLRPDAPGLSKIAQTALPESGIENPVTAVILNFRGYDTLLEISVLFLVTVAVVALFQFEPVSASRNIGPGVQVLTAFLHIMTPLMVLVAFYLLWVGSFAPGGAFQAGAILASSCILLLLGGAYLPLRMDQSVWKLILAFGLGGFILVGFAVMSKERTFLDYPPSAAKNLILLVEAMCTVSIAAIFISLFAICAGLDRRKPLKHGDSFQE